MLTCANPACKWKGPLTPERTALDQMNRPCCGLCRSIAVKVTEAAPATPKPAAEPVRVERVTEPEPMTLDPDSMVPNPPAGVIESAKPIEYDNRSSFEKDNELGDDFDDEETPKPKPKKRGSSGRFQKKS